jgi:hypothetical protein
LSKIAYILLCHKDPQGIVKQAQALTSAGDFVAIHFDARSPKAAYDEIRAGLADNPGVCFAKKRLKCGWGEWSLVAATLNAVKAAVEAFPRASHFYMVSGDCAPIKPAQQIHDFLDATDVDYIESFDFYESDWIKTGIKAERLMYRHWFNERTRKKWFYKSLELQQRFGLKREVPKGLKIMIGSQWWCLRRRTIEAILDYVAANRDVLRFFRTTWIPDETFFQTLVRHLVSAGEIRTRTLTFLLFTDYGMPVTFYNDHYEFLVRQNSLFARKISSEAKDLRSRLAELYRDENTHQVTGDGKRVFEFLRSRGRSGLRYAPRVWEQGATIGRGRQLDLIFCKKWHVAKRLARKIEEVTGRQVIDYAFDEVQTALPDLGGIEASLAKRNRHRRAFLRLLYERTGLTRLALLLDPARFDLLADLKADRVALRVLEVECNMPDDYLKGHAERIGLLEPGASAETVERMLPAIRNDIAHEIERIRDDGQPAWFRCAETQSRDENAAALAAFLGISPESGARVVALDHLFSD